MLNEPYIQKMMYDDYQRKIAVQYLSGFLSLLKNLPAAIKLFARLVILQRNYRLNSWFILLPYLKPQTRVFSEWIKEYRSNERKILDIGCGVCSLDVALLDQGFQDIVSVDVQELYLKAARELLAKYKELPLIRGDANALPLKNQLFDIVALLDLSYFGAVDLDTCLSEVFRLLKPEGILIADFYETSVRDDVKCYQLNDLIQLLRSHSLHPVKVFPIYHPGSFPYGYMLMMRKRSSNDVEGQRT